MQKFANLNILEREQVGRCIFKEEQFCVRLHDWVLKSMEVDEQQEWVMGLIGSCFNECVEIDLELMLLQEKMDD